MAKKTILVVEDEDDILELLCYNLQREGYKVTSATSGGDALTAISRNVPNLIILDLMLPDLSGLDICRSLKENSRTAGIPILMVTAKSEDSDVVTGLELGADDYITKPFSMKVLIARVRSSLRRKQLPAADDNKTVHVNDMVIDPVRHEVLIKGKPVAMTFCELRILHFLASRPGFVMTREQIVDAVRGENYAVTDRAVDVQIVGIRKKLGARFDYIETVRGAGYRFKEWQ